MGVSADRILAGGSTDTAPHEVTHIPAGKDYEEAAKKIDAVLADDEELLAFWNELKQRPDLQLLFRQVRPLSPESIRRIIRLIKAIEEEEEMES